MEFERNMDAKHILPILLFIYQFIGFNVVHSLSAFELFHSERNNEDLMWCCLTNEELQKCYDFAKVAADYHEKDETLFGSYYRSLKCKLYNNKNECMRVIDENRPTHPNFMRLEAGDVFNGGRYHSLLPILKEVYEQGDFVTSVAVVKSDTLLNVQHFEDLRGVHACFSGVGNMAGWTIPIHKLMEANILKIIDCNNHIKTISEFFGESCAVDSLQDRYNPLGDNSHKLCELCGSNVRGIRCTGRDPYAGFLGAYKCLKEKGEIAFMDGNILERLDDTEGLELLCPDDNGLLIRSPITEVKNCAWGVAPGSAIVVSSAMPDPMREIIQIFLTRAFEKFGEDPDPDYSFSMLESAPKYGNFRNIMFDDNLKGLDVIPPKAQSYKAYLDKIYGDSLITPMNSVEGIRKCPISQMTLCVTSFYEMKKCARMRAALNAQLLQPKMTCKRARNSYECTRMIAANEADIAVMEAGDIYRAGWSYGLIPIMAEIYNLPEPYYYAVAVVKQRDNSSELIYLKNRNTCHTGVGHAAGWVIPLSWLLGNERVRDYDCDSSRAAAEYFSKSCAPGILSPEFRYNYYGQKDYWEYSHLCDLCHGTGQDYCVRNHMEDYFGNTGAFRCLVEGGGHVAFVKHTTVYENCDGKRKEWWARNQLTSDYELLCRDGTRAPIRQYKHCHLGKVKSNAVITNPSFSEERINSYINLLKYAQQYYGQKVLDEFSFSMFISDAPHADLIFQDATQQLVVVPEEERDYTKYLDKEFLKAYTMVECRSISNQVKPLAIVYPFSIIAALRFLPLF
uniref:Melanotransferrinlike [Bombus impatiens] n=1 Tax=Lepeophtheirus salmonis TaxID=72036 RepID=A0A0K2UG72_LEPSM